MQKITLHFNSLSGLTTFSRMIIGGYVIDIKTLTITGNFLTPHISIARQVYEARII